MALIAGLDLETTGLLGKDGTPGDQRIVEVCVQLWCLESRSRKLNFVQRIDPQRSITEKAQAVHGITAADLIGKPLWDEVAPKTHVILNKSIMTVAHNGVGFDAPFINGEFRRVGLSEVGPFLDTMLNGRFATPTGAVPSLEKLCFSCGVYYDHDLAHGADYDVTVMMECFFKALDWGWITLPSSVIRDAA
ncbi:3'-5' exonuclease [Roseospira marina]|uniref:3'-5' exonuclease n=1 Tax=Roseospira marina TaxID=140057 RepID=A0A5M6I7Y0_9PROT|nr:3'-5' exonuclease [Roseospira marina]KAA5604384.1 3'-5' exonuclease [Roseospira marina]MBB4315427.1 DNA polymerase-3 subunit epsilon [Roseospira marina]MBB5088427.1 DNA polymerase-3 subunit epsilon [Roseospira marina]